ncbi:hypothetical protein GGS24DRAFT_440350 [Hypoxylon argillaceum]|nr:hypothetical protein GGS24DRAFT_440350 [Hypoxylon argillaceum]KAI1154783.1 hypothetical protein F4825DRAFT_448216 [Nemania diffusa]
MKPATVAFTLASAAVAQDLPDCAKSCLAKFTTGDQIGDCARLDAKCICASDSFISGIACCLAGVCDAADQKQAVDYARSFCSTQGVTDLPQSVTCASASGTAAASTSSTTTASTTVPTVAATPNAGALAGMGSKVSFCGGLLAALAVL